MTRPSGIRKRQRPLPFSVAASEWIATKSRKWSPKTLIMSENWLKNLLPEFGRRLVIEIEARDIARYQKKRLNEDGVSNRSVNIEVGDLRAILKKYGAWSRIQPDVTMLRERDDADYALPWDEESRLSGECGNSRSRVLLPFVVLAIETGARYGTLQRLQWKNIDFAGRCLTFGKDKRTAGSHRTIPLSQRAIEALQFRAQQFPNRKPEHFVFLYERCGGAGSDETFGFTGATIYESNPEKPFGSLKLAWEPARARAGLPHLRSHDLRHTAASRMIAAGVPLPVVGKILGLRPSTLARMAARYGHFSVEEMRPAVEAINHQSSQGYPKFSPKPLSEENKKIR